MNAYLNQLAQTLQEQGYTVHLVPLNQGGTSSQLVVELETNPPLRLTAFFLGDLLHLAADEDADPVMQQMEAQQTDFLQLFINFPFDFEDYALPDLARLILMANWSTPVGAFGLNESRRIIYYRHVFECLGAEPSIAVVMEAVTAMAYYAGLRFASLQQIGAARLTLADYLDSLEKQNLRSEEFPGYDL